ncbi:MAG: hypothetical protein U1A77_13695 [Pirellulales bacterium]
MAKKKASQKPVPKAAIKASAKKPAAKKSAVKKSSGKSAKSSKSAAEVTSLDAPFVQKFSGLTAPMHVVHELHGDACCSTLRFGAGASVEPGAVNMFPGSDYEVRYEVDGEKGWKFQVIQSAGSVAEGGVSAMFDPPPGMCFCLETRLQRMCPSGMVPLCGSSTITCVPA